VTGAEPVAPARTGVLLPGILALAGFVLLLALGTWQLERKSWKENLIATLERRLAAAPTALPPSRDWPGLAPDNAEFRRVKALLDFPGLPPAYVYTSGSALRPDVRAPGYFVFVPARIASGEIVVVNVGYSPERSDPGISGSAEVIGYLRWPESPSWFMAERDRAGTTWFVRDHRAMARASNWGNEVAPFYLDKEGPSPAGGTPRPGPLIVKLRNDHLGYALTWFGLAAALACIFLLWARARRRSR
jgi:cytochrome oxidase assembly protein ShyY1